MDAPLRVQWRSTKEQWRRGCACGSPLRWSPCLFGGGVGSGCLRMAVAAELFPKLLQRYPGQLCPRAIQGFDTKLPASIRLMCAIQLTNLGQIDTEVGGWECQSASRVGHLRGLEEPRASHFFDLMRCLNYLQERQVYPPVSILKNTFAGSIAEPRVWEFVGAPAVVDAASVGFSAHRVRSIWSYILPAAAMLERYHQPSLAFHDDHPPFVRLRGGGYVCGGVEGGRGV